jgi:hypothetical protein
MAELQEKAVGQLEVLSVGQGHIRIKFDKDDAVEFQRARRIIADMLKRGYVLLVEHDGKLQRVRRFDETTDEYIVADGPLNATDEEESPPAEQAKRGRRPREKRVPLKEGQATGVAPTAGG